jgi:hypothetical protein
VPGNCDVRKIKEKNTSAELSGCRTVLPLGAEMSHTGAELSGCRNVSLAQVPKCLAFQHLHLLYGLQILLTAVQTSTRLECSNFGIYKCK